VTNGTITDLAASLRDLKLSRLADHCKAGSRMPPRVSGGEIGISSDTLDWWPSEALAMPNRDKTWKAAARLEAVITTSAMDEAAKSAWCRRQDVYPSELEKWRNSAVETLAAPEESPASPQQTRQDHPLDKGA
jgi:transposase